LNPIVLPIGKYVFLAEMRVRVLVLVRVLVRVRVLVLVLVRVDSQHRYYLHQ
jgi:hypothetical protein